MNFSTYSQSPNEIPQSAALENSEKPNQYESLTQATVYQSHGERGSQEINRSPEHASNNNNSLVFTKKANWPPLTEAATS